MFDRALVRRTVALVAALAMITTAGAAVAAQDGSLDASPATPGETSTHTATVTVGDDATGSLNGFAVDYSNASGADVSDVGTGDVAKIGIDRDDDQSGDTVDTTVGDDLDAVQTSNDGRTVTFDLGGSYQLQSGDEVVVVFEDVRNPDAGEYDVGLDVNPQSSGGETSATLSVGSMDGGDGDDSTTAMDGDDGGSSDGGSPGFGVGVALVAVTAAALLALRRTD